MSATVAAALKKIAVAVLTDKKLRRTVLGIVLGVIIIIIMPVAAVISLFNGDIEIDTDRLQTLVVENLSAEKKAKLQAVENTMYAIEDEMKAAGFTAEKAKEARVLYVLALSDYAEQTDFVSKLLGCFAEEQTDKQLIIAVNTAFGTTLNAEDFTKVMTAIRAKAINTSGFTEPDTKNAHDLVEWAKQAHAKKWGYVWGTYDDVLTEAVLNGKVSPYPDEVGGKEEYIRTHWLGGRTADCIGLIKGYAWFNCDTGQIEYRSNGVRDTGSDPMLDMATEKGTIDTMPDIPGIAVWMDGHIGIYVGDGQTIHAANTELGVIMTPLAHSGWTHWLKIPYITYLENAAVREQKSTCFQSRKQVRGAVFGFGRGKLPIPLFNPSANQNDRKHSDHNHSGNPYGRKHPYPTPLDNSQQLQHNKDNRQNGYDAKPALFCFIIHIVFLRSPS